MKGLSHYDTCGTKPTCQSRQRAKVFSPAAMPFQGENGLSREAQLIRHSNPDAAIADIETEEAGLSRRIQALPSRIPA